MNIIDLDLHDGLLKGIVLDDDGGGSVSLYASSVSQTNYRIRFVHVVRLRVIDFLQGNIILSVTLTEGDDIADEDILTVYDRTIFPAWLDRTKMSKYSMVSIQPSYGAQVYILLESSVSESSMIEVL